MLLVMTFVYAFLGVQNVFAASIIQVYLNQNELNYQDVAPQIIEGRAMVPIRETANFLGFELDWDEDTRTVTLTKGSLTIGHTLFEDVIYKNGVRSEPFVTHSRVIDGRNVMPVRMLEEVVDAKIDWYADTRSVYITTGAQPAISYASSELLTLTVGETQSVEVTANNATEVVRLANRQGQVLSTSSTYSDSGDNRIFSVTYTATASTLGEIEFHLEPGAGETFNRDGRISLRVSVEKGSSIVDATISTANANVGEEITVTATGNQDTTIAKVVDANGVTLAETTTYENANSSVNREFKLVFTLKDEGNQTFNVYTGRESAYGTDYKTVSITVGALQTMEIKTLDYETSIRSNDTLTVKVTTSLNVSYLLIKDRYGNVRTESYDYTTQSATERVWTLYYRIPTDGTFTDDIFGYDSEKSESTKVSRTIRFAVGAGYYVEGDEKNATLKIFQLTPSQTTAYTHDWIEMVAYTSDDIDEVWINDSTGVEVGRSTFSTTESDSYRLKWVLDFTFENPGTYYLYAKDIAGLEVNSSFSMALH